MFLFEREREGVLQGTFQFYGGQKGARPHGPPSQCDMASLPNKSCVLNKFTQVYFRFDILVSKTYHSTFAYN